MGLPGEMTVTPSPSAAPGPPGAVFIIAGEASGDWSGSLLVRAMRRARPELSFRGIGGRRLAAAGVEVRFDSSSWGAIGVFDALKKVPRMWRAMHEVQAELNAHPPGLLVLVDFGAFNMRLARAIKDVGIPTLYYFPPSSWRRRLRRPELKDLVDVIATPFPWSAELLSGGRARAEWVGHPVVDSAQPRLSRAEAYDLYRLDPARPVVALAPGSRDQELRYLFPVLAAAGAKLTKQFPGLQVVIPVAPTLDRERVAAELARAGLTAKLLNGMDYDALQLAQAAAVCSGTATLEFCCLGIPMVITYRTSRATTLEYRLMRGLFEGQRLAGMPNIIAGREIVPERMGSGATAETIAGDLAAFLNDAGLRARTKAALEEVRATLGPPGATERAARLALELLGAREGCHAAAG